MTKFTQRHYISIANALADAMNTGNVNPMGGIGTRADLIHMADILDILSDVFEEDDPSFNKEIFFKHYYSRLTTGD